MKPTVKYDDLVNMKRRIKRHHHGGPALEIRADIRRVGEPRVRRIRAVLKYRNHRVIARSSWVPAQKISYEKILVDPGHCLRFKFPTRPTIPAGRQVVVWFEMEFNDGTIQRYRG